MMKNFGSTFLACLLAVFASSIVTTAIGVMLLVGLAMASFDKPALEVKDNSILKIDLSKTVVDMPSTDPSSLFNPMSMTFNSGGISLLDAINAIDKAKNDDKIKGIYLNVDPSLGGTGISNIEELREALLDFKSSGKFIVSYADMYSQISYFLSSVADSIYIHPEGDLSWMGMAGQFMFFGGTMEKFGVEPIVVRHGKYKAAVEPFIQENMSEANREQNTKMLGSIWGHIVKQIGIQRNIDSALLQQYATELTIGSPKDAVEKSMADATLYADEMSAKLIELSETSEEKPEFISLDKYIKAPDVNKSTTFQKNKVAVIYATGNIVDNGSPSKEIVGNDMADNIAKARKDSTVKAIVFRVNSPGGSALASDVIWREVTLAIQEKPVIVSMGEYAASGGYYISCPADMIIANPTTLTGSIGVFGLYFNVAPAAKKLLGVNVDVVSTNPSADMGSMFRTPTKTELDFAQKSVERVYETFIGHVAEGRNMTTEAVDEIGQGRVWSGIDAVQIGLVDALGGLKGAIKVAATKAGLGDDYRITSFPETKDSPFAALAEMLGEDISTKSPVGEITDDYLYLKNLIENQGVQAIIPYRIEIK